MAHFAELDENNVVLRVIVVDNKDTTDDQGVEREEVGINFCKSLFGEHTRWAQTSYNNNIRGKYAIVGDTYDPELDKFIPIPVVQLFDPEEVTPTPTPEG